MGISGGGVALVADITLEQGGSYAIKKMKKCEKGVCLSTFEDLVLNWSGDDGGKMDICDERGVPKRGERRIGGTKNSLRNSWEGGEGSGGESILHYAGGDRRRRRRGNSEKKHGEGFIEEQRRGDTQMVDLLLENG